MFEWRINRLYTISTEGIEMADKQRKTNWLYIMILLVIPFLPLFFSSNSVYAETIKPVVTFDQEPKNVGEKGLVTLTGENLDTSQLSVMPATGFSIKESERTANRIVYQYHAGKVGTYRLSLKSQKSDAQEQLSLASLTIEANQANTETTSTGKMTEPSTAVQSTQNSTIANASTSSKGETSKSTKTSSNSSEAMQPAIQAPKQVGTKGTTIHTLSDSERNKLGQLWDYNAYLTGEHSANMADTEGAIAVKGNSVFPNDLQTFTYGASFREQNTTIGDPIRPDQYVNVLLGGEIINHATNDWVKPVVENRTTNGYSQGWLVAHAPMEKWIYKNLGEWFSALAYETDDATIQTAFAKLQTQQEQLTNQLSLLTAGVEAPVYQGDGFELAPSKQDPKVLILTFKKDSTPLTIKTLSIPNDFLKGTHYKQILVTSSAEKIVMNGTSIAGTTQQDAGTYSDLASKLTFYFPKATSIVNYLEDDGSYPDTSKVGVDVAGEDNYGKSDGKNYYHSFTIGSIIAPQATVVYHSGSINGYVFAKNLHQRDGMEIHNFYNPWLPDIHVEGKGQVQIHKSDQATQQVLADAEFGIRKKGTTDFLDVKATDKNGTLTFADLAYGDYEIVETKAPEGYQLNEEVYPVEVSEQSQTVTVQMENTKQEVLKTHLQLHKTDQATHADLAGAVYGLRGLREKNFRTATTDKSGMIDFTDLTPGFYELVELISPNGYQVDSKPQIIQVGLSDKAQKMEVTDQKMVEKKGSIQLRKIDQATGKPLKNVVFGVRTLDEKIFITKKTDENGVVKFDNLKAGTFYTVAEITAPTGYTKTAQNLVVKINNPAQEVNIGEWTNQKETESAVKGAVKIIKSDNTNGNLLKGAQFGIRALGQREFQKKTTDNKGEVLFTDLVAGVYEIRELAAPSGYTNTSLTQKVVIDLAKPEQTMTIKWTNEKSAAKLGSATIIKTDETGHPLAGATFAIRNDHERQFSKTTTSNAAGEAYFNNLPLGRYDIIETTAPDGYQLDGKIYHVQVTEEENGSAEIATIINHKKEAATGQVVLEKRDTQTHKILPGVEFALEDANGKLLQTYTTDKEGRIFVDKLAIGHYQFVETKALPGYVLDPKPKKFEVTKENLNKLQLLTVTNELEKTPSSTSESSEESTTSTTTTTYVGRSSDEQNVHTSVDKGQKKESYPQTNDRNQPQLIVLGLMILGSAVYLIKRRK